MKKERNIQIEIVRILAMFMIVLGHAVLYGHAAEKIHNNVYGGVLTTAIETFATPGTDIFVLISGYFLVKSKINVKRIIVLWLQILFYSVSIYLLMLTLGITKFSYMELIKACFPIAFNQYWFMRVYFYLILCVPFLNKLINSLEKKEHKRLILLGIVLMVIPASIPGIALFNNDAGNGILWFIMLYLTGAYLQIYPPRFSAKSYTLMAFVFFMIAFFSRIGISWLSTLLGFSGMGENRLCTFDSFPIYAEAYCIVCAGIKMNLKIRHNSLGEKAILFLSESTAGVYMIHEHPLIRSTMWKWMDLENHMILYTLLMVVLIFVICATIDQLTWKKIAKYLKKINNR